ncbi:DUF177 domain-containing protein [filamentous cyanobacterium LEGE 11480]|uniref:DUF177 domain-containing protein n=1 Tax=Romeriopsis navalis LEGE 11480 TaxID=2777977 RepID=A0A928VQM6_9CYAN|nr:YceD family protein [Romeriopsis navalis]MBE9031962.1 DUF177 domain-containing protein [Romeriopsis navalis LEGE 11480]
MDAIHIPNLAHHPDKRVTIDFKQLVKDLKSLTPVQGTVTVMHKGNYLEVQVQAKTIVTLTCDRCLQQYNHRLNCDADEIIWLKDSELIISELPLNQDLELDDMVENLPEDGNFDVEAWVYEQLCLALPQRKLCDGDCKGIDVPQASPEDLTDRRWAALSALKNQLPDLAD